MPLITHEEFQFNAKLLGFEIGSGNVYNNEVLNHYFSEYFNDKEYHDVPDEMVITGGLFVMPYHCISFPKNKLIVKGGLFIASNPVVSLPDTLIVSGSLSAQVTVFPRFPKNLKIKGSIHLQNSKITELPDNLVVHGDLMLQYCHYIAKLPLNLDVRGDLYLKKSSIKEIPVGTKAEHIVTGWD